MNSETQNVMLQVVKALETLAVEYAIGGSMASSIHGMMRSTLDIDIIADIQPQHILPLIALLKDNFYADDQMMLDAIIHHSCFNLIHYQTAFKVDIFVPKQRPFEKQQLQRRQPIVIQTQPETIVYFASPEDTILAKLEWYRLGGEISERQWRDVLGIIKVQDDLLNLPYLHHWAAELNITDLLERILQEK